MGSVKRCDESLQRSSLMEQTDFVVGQSDTEKPSRKTGPDDSVLDGPWSFVVGLASFLAQVMLGGYVYTGGIYYTVFIEQYEERGPIAISWLCNMPATLWFLGSPLGSVLTNKFGSRVSSYIGGCMASVGLVVGSLTSNFYVLFLGYGIVAGFGHGIMYVGFISSVSRYFKKYRAMVTILTTLGPMVGMSLYSFLIQYLIQQLHWRGSLMILGGLALNICTCASVLFPLDFAVSRRQMSFISVLRIRTFVLFGCNCIFIAVAASLIFVHLPSLIISYGLGANMASVALTVFAISNSLAKVICSIVGQFIPADPVNVYTVFLTVYSVAILLLPALGVAAWILIVITVMAFCFNVCGGHTMEVVLDLTGPDQFTNGVGLTQAFKSVGVLVAGPLAGLLYGFSDDYRTTFYVGGCMGLAGCAFLVPVVVQRCRGRKSGRGDAECDITVASPDEEEESSKWLKKDGDSVMQASLTNMHTSIS